MNQIVPARPPSVGIAKIIYVLYLLGFFAGITAVIGLVMAYIYKDDAPEWLRTHYELQIRTFWIMLLYGLIAGILCIILIGFLLLFLVALWWIIRCVKGLKYLDQNTAYPDHRGWLF
ncbi:membrane protein [Steroidobacter denitrificans]|uniref:Membrane protein n=1 Tax=Steroidobacter denitrificans TaxID=465721 RepID=A0A127F841_STEDE|nr:DUF4870 domain-containing protein [Steroidobacter denitrificans]AMN46567.1 membrane protein [Steroidobacter denitrificans]